MTPLIVGMTAILLVLGCGVTAAGSAFLAGQRIQNACDGAAAAAGDALTPGSSDQGQVDAATDAAQRYLTIHGSDIAVLVDVDAGRALLTCSADPAVTFGWLFGSPTVHRVTTAGSQPGLRD